MSSAYNEYNKKRKKINKETALPNQESIGMLRKKNFKCLVILEIDTITKIKLEDKI